MSVYNMPNLTFPNHLKSPFPIFHSRPYHHSRYNTNSNYLPIRAGSATHHQGFNYEDTYVSRASQRYYFVEFRHPTKETSGNKPSTATWVWNLSPLSIAMKEKANWNTILYQTARSERLVVVSTSLYDSGVFEARKLH